MKTLILTEKPSVARDFARALGVRAGKDGFLENKDFIITWTIGHLVELLEPEDYNKKWAKWRIEDLPILPEQFDYKPIAATRKQLQIIKTLLTRKEIGQLVIATDAGREGEVIARTVLHFSGKNRMKNTRRFWTSQALTPQVVREAMQSLKPASEFDRLWRAGRARQIADWLIGMNGSRAATIRLKDLFSVGRVQTAVLALLTDRLRERRNFTPEPFWHLYATFENEKGSWKGLWFNKKETRIRTEEEAQRIRDIVSDQTGKVTSVQRRKKKEPPPLLFSLTDLQAEANRRFGFSAKRTLDIAQALYEEKKCLSYPRTDARVLGSKNVDLARDIVNNLSRVWPEIFAGVDPKRIDASYKRVFNDARLTDHHALIPLQPIPSNANKAEKDIYMLALTRFSGAFHPDCEFEQTEIITAVRKETFRTKGKVILKMGWRVLQKPDSRKDTKKEDEASDLPPLEKNDTALVRDTTIEKKMTQPPPEYTEALLLKDMTNPARYVSAEDLKKIYRGDIGLGTQATRAQIIETLLSRKYAVRIKKTLVATEKGCRLIDVLRSFENASTLTSPDETARWERQLDLIAQGNGSDEKFLEQIVEFVKRTVTELKSSAPGSNVHPEKGKFGRCPRCNGEIIEGKRGFGCANWRKEDGGCQFVIWKQTMGKTITPQILKNLLTKGSAGPFPDFRSEAGTPYSGILKLTGTGKETEMVCEPVKIPQKKDRVGICPACGGDIVETKKAFGCANWKEADGGCSFAIWKTIAEKKISKKTAARLLTSGKTEVIEGFVSKKGKPFSASLKIGADASGNYRVLFEFPNPGP